MNILLSLPHLDPTNRSPCRDMTPETRCNLLYNMSPHFQSDVPPSMSFWHNFTYHLRYFLFTWKAGTQLQQQPFRIRFSVAPFNTGTYIPRRIQDWKIQELIHVVVGRGSWSSSRSSLNIIKTIFEGLYICIKPIKNLCLANIYETFPFIVFLVMALN